MVLGWCPECVAPPSWAPSNHGVCSSAKLAWTRTIENTVDSLQLLIRGHVQNRP